MVHFVLDVLLESVQCQCFLLGGGLSCSVTGDISVGDGIIDHIHRLTQFVHSGDLRFYHQSIYKLGMHPNVIDTSGQVLVGADRSGADGKAIVQFNTVDVDGMAAELLNTDALRVFGEQFHSTQAPLNRICIRDGCERESADACVAAGNGICPHLGEAHRDFLVAKVLTGKGGFHILDIFLTAIKRGVRNLRQIVQHSPVRICKQFLKYQFALCIRLCVFKFHQLAIQILQGNEHTHNEDQNQHSVCGVENQRTDTGTLAGSGGGGGCLCYRCGFAARVGEFTCHAQPSFRSVPERPESLSARICAISSLSRNTVGIHRVDLDWDIFRTKASLAAGEGPVKILLRTSPAPIAAISTSVKIRSKARRIRRPIRPQV